MVDLLTRAVRARDRRRWIVTAALLLGIAAVLGVLWRVMRTNAEMSVWAPWQTTAQAVGEALLLSPRGYTVTLTVSVLLALASSPSSSVPDCSSSPRP